MRILVVGAGAIGGYFGGRLAAAGRDVTFLVRPKRAEILREKGLVIRSPLGDAHIAAPKLVTADDVGGTFDLILLSSKAYDLQDAIASFAPAVGPQTAILPLLNGMGHLDRLEARFGPKAVLGGTCFISTTIGRDGEILHMNDIHRLTYGDRHGGMTARIEAIATVFAEAGFTAEASETILSDMWGKWIFIAATAGMTCLMRCSIGDFVAAGASNLALKLIDECAEIAAGHGFKLSKAAQERIRENLTRAGSPITASMLRDIEADGRIESDQIIGDLLARADPVKRPSYFMLETVYAHLKAYEARRAREG
ncbi:2-dehydropantoate 2-reductase [Rhizobium calliandrae]|uniref:2-dehydropantoate 2-reductase n=1 Tax=Rhizobium calliandrae TaxID=1312182 RepID=A0ABT7K965_9HYPH|nr:2-dehydropantoate 2-reductase [Rhizobium calliandrae]MDL2405165.1 2-dehydropantoate 2-reductase [Rhizobium calliandrae]